jgi:lysine 2,3-aminomutase
MDLNLILENRKILSQDPNFGTSIFQLSHRVLGKDLEQYFSLTEDEKFGILKTIRLNVATTPYYLLLADPLDPNCPIRRMIIPVSEESVFSSEESDDPLDEERLSPVKGLTHMYPDRVLLFSNYECSVYCRHCMRGRKVSDSKQRMTREDLDRAFDYIRKNNTIEDVVISGGDPLNLSDSKLEYILQNLESIDHVKICRLGTRNPVTNPFRFTPDLLEILEKYNNDHLSIFLNTQFNHVKECTQIAKDTIFNIMKKGISVGNQSVILKGINDSGPKMLDLHKKLLEMRIRAYYMYDPELIPGSRHFRTPLQKGLEIIEYMRGKISGMGIPHFVNDLPGGGGKITMTPNWYLGFDSETNNHYFRSAVTGNIHKSFEPLDSIYKERYKRYEKDSIS